MSNATANGRMPRKQLADQLDRLDSILDGLSDALNESVADAAREGAKAAVKEILTEIVTNPKFAGLLRANRPATNPEPTQASPSKPSWLAGIKSSMLNVIRKVATGVCGLMAGLRRQAGVVVSRCRSTAKPMGSVLDVLRLAGSLRKALLVAGGVGLVVGLVSLLTPHWASATIGAVGGTTTALALQTANAVKTIFVRFRTS